MACKAYSLASLAYPGNPGTSPELEVDQKYCHLYAFSANSRNQARFYNLKHNCHIVIIRIYKIQNQKKYIFSTTKQNT